MTQPSWKAHELTVGELAARSGVATSALRYYERHGLIHSRRTSGNQRRYGRDVLRRIAFIRASQRVGVSLSDIRAALALLPDNRTPNREDWARVSERWYQDLTERIEQLHALRDSLTECIGCGCLSLSRCALANRYDRLGTEQGPGAHRLLHTEPDPEQRRRGCQPGGEC